MHANLRDEVESLDANLRGEVESLRENLRGGVESLQANLRPWIRTQAFAGKMVVQVYIQTCEGVESLPANLQGRLKVCIKTCRGRVESLLVES